MLPYFPTPYPDELWYSVLCRYHVRTGNPTSAATFRELLEGRDSGALASLLPNAMIAEIAGRLPEGILDIEDIALNHTLFPYIFRFQPVDVKQKLLAMTRHGKIEFPVRLPKPYASREMKICPVCMREDIKQYGEAYWHLSHQIPFVSVCHTHRCRLKSRCFKRNELNHNFILPDSRDMDVIDFHVTEPEVKLARMLTCYLELPFEAGPTEGYNNLYTGIINAGYGIVRKDKEYSVNYGKLETDLYERFGREIIIHFLGTEHLRAAIFGNIRHWKYKLPERYALLATFIGQEPEITFSSARLLNETDRKFMELSQSGIIRSKKYIAERLGVKENHLDMISYNLGIRPFWEQRPTTEALRECVVTLNLTKEERAYVDSRVQKDGFPSASAFIRFCIEKVKKGSL